MFLNRSAGALRDRLKGAAGIGIAWRNKRHHWRVGEKYLSNEFRANEQLDVLWPTRLNCNRNNRQGFSADLAIRCRRHPCSTWTVWSKQSQAERSVTAAGGGSSRSDQRADGRDRAVARKEEMLCNTARRSIPCQGHVQSGEGTIEPEGRVPSARAIPSDIRQCC